MTLKVDRSSEEKGVVYTLVGRIKEEQVPGLRDLLTKDAEKSRVVLDLTEIRLIDYTAVKFLARCEEDGVSLRNCPPYIREWISRESRKVSSDGSPR
jgi:anti-anti-sigma regulatory factor